MNRYVLLLVSTSRFFLMTYHRVFNWSNTTVATSGAGSSYPSGAPEFTPSFQWSSCCSVFSFQCDILYLIVCHLYLFLFGIGLHVILRISASDYPFSIFKLFLKNDIIENIMKDIFNLNGIEMFGSSLPPVVCGRAHVLFTLNVFACAEWCQTHIVLCCVFVLFFFILCVLCCRVLWNVHF